MKRKNKHREKKVEEATNLWCTWMGEIHTNFRENGHQLPSKTPWERGGARPKWLGRAGGRRRAYKGQLSAG